VPSFRRRVLLLALPLAVVLAACNATPSASTVAATVNGQDILITELEERLEALRANPQAAQQLADDPDGSVLADAQGQLLTDLIRFRLLETAASEDLDYEVTDADVDEQRDLVVEELGGQEAFDQFIAEQGLSEEEVNTQLRQLALQSGIGEALAEENQVTDEDVEAYYDQNAEAEFGPSATVRHILVEDEATATSVLERLEAGEDFADLAQELSIDTASAQVGGDLGDVIRGATVPEFEEAVFSAPLDTPTGPVQTQFGFHILEVTERNDEPQPLEDVEDQIREQLEGQRSQELAQTFLDERVAEAEIEVNPRFGVWNAETGQVEPETPLGDASEPVEGGEGGTGEEPAPEPTP
jgi:parvulin-like peptidyl-prolyl isomerase